MGRVRIVVDSIEDSTSDMERQIADEAVLEELLSIPGWMVYVVPDDEEFPNLD